MTDSIADFGLTALELEAKYLKYDYHHAYNRYDWRKSEAKLPYWEWVEEQIALEEDSLSRDNPYTRNY